MPLGDKVKGPKRSKLLGPRWDENKKGLCVPKRCLNAGAFIAKSFVLFLQCRSYRKQRTN